MEGPAHAGESAGGELEDLHGDADASRLLGLDRDQDFQEAEREHPELVAVVTPARSEGPGGLPCGLPEEGLRQAGTGSWHGQANTLSPAHAADWPVIDLQEPVLGSRRHRPGSLPQGGGGWRATGIGCYFDELVHDLFGLSPDWQSLYHFTVGGPVEDARLTTLPAYGPGAGA